MLGESIGDLGGVKIAYLAFQKDQKEKAQPTIDGFTPDQQFFVAWGQFRGDEIRSEAQRKMIQGDPHPMAKFRVIGPLSNLPQFARRFRARRTPMVRPPTGARSGKRRLFWGTTDKQGRGRLARRDRCLGSIGFEVDRQCEAVLSRSDILTKGRSKLRPFCVWKRSARRIPNL